MAFDLKTLEKVLALAKKHKLAEVELEDGKNKIKIKTAISVQPIVSGTAVSGVSAASQMMPMSDRPLPLEESPKDLSGMDEGRYAKVMSPFVGTFYRAASPDADPYAKEGQMIKKGDVLCIVEAMKLMNEIESEVSGKIISVLVENGQPVEYGEPLFLIDPV